MEVGTDVPIWLRPEHAKVGRPAERSRAEITRAAVALADAEGLSAVSMRRVAAGLGTGAASLYRYVATRDDLLDLMIDSTGAEYVLAEPTGKRLADLVALGVQARTIMRRHPWLPTLLTTRTVLGPHSADVLEHYLAILDGHPTDATAKLEAFALLNSVTAVFVQYEIGADPAAARNVATYLHHLAAAGGHPHIAALMAESARTAAKAPPAATEPPDLEDRFPVMLARVLSGALNLP